MVWNENTSCRVIDGKSIGQIMLVHLQPMASHAAYVIHPIISQLISQDFGGFLFIFYQLYMYFGMCLHVYVCTCDLHLTIYVYIVCMLVHMCVWMYAYVDDVWMMYGWLHLHVYTFVNVHIYEWMYVRTYLCMCIYLVIYVRMHLCMYGCIVPTYECYILYAYICITYIIIMCICV